MKTSDAGRQLIIAREGKRLKAYRDSEGVWTIGVGHTGRMTPPPVTPGMTITDAQCDAFLAGDLAPVEAEINRLVRVSLTQNQFDALTSWLFNVGVHALARSTVLARLNEGDRNGAAEALMMWVKPAILKERRLGERKQFLTPDSRSAPPTSGPSPAPASVPQQAAKESKPMNPISGMLAEAKLAYSVAVPIFQTVVKVAQHKDEIEQRLGAVVTNLEQAFEKFKHLDVNSGFAELGEAWVEGMKAYEIVNMSREQVSSVAQQAKNAPAPAVVTSLESIGQSIAKTLGLG